MVYYKESLHINEVSLRASERDWRKELRAFLFFVAANLYTSAYNEKTSDAVPIRSRNGFRGYGDAKSLPNEQIFASSSGHFHAAVRKKAAFRELRFQTEARSGSR